MPGTLSPERERALREAWQRSHRGPGTVQIVNATSTYTVIDEAFARTEDEWRAHHDAIEAARPPRPPRTLAPDHDVR